VSRRRPFAGPAGAAAPFAAAAFGALGLPATSCPS